MPPRNPMTTLESPLGQLVRLAMPPTVLDEGRHDPRLIRQTEAATLAAGAATFMFRPVPMGRFGRYYRVVIAGTGISGATVALYSGSALDINLLDWDTVPGGGLGSVFAPSSRGAYEIDPGANLLVVITGAGTGEVTGNAYFELVTWNPVGERLPKAESPAIPPPDHDTGSVDFYPPHTDALDREGGNPKAPPPLGGTPDWLYPSEGLEHVQAEINWTGTDNA